MRPARTRAAVAVLVALLPLLAACRTPPDAAPDEPAPGFPEGWRVVDLTRPLDAETPHLPHPQGFPFERIPLTGEAAGRLVGAWSATGIMGTHVEAPSVFGGAGTAITRIAPEHLALPAVVLDAAPDLDVTAAVASGAALESAEPLAPPAVAISAILAHEARHGRIPRGSIVLLRTGDGDVASGELALAGRAPAGGYRHRGWSEDAVRFLASERGVRAIGTDALTVDPGDRVDDSPAARAAATVGLYTVQSLAGLGTLPRRGAVVVIGVLPVRDAHAAQARVLAFLPPADRADAASAAPDEPAR